MKVSLNKQRVAADILTSFASVESLEDFRLIYDEVFEEYALFKDPFTLLPVDAKTYSQSLLSYEKQIMEDRFGHHDGL